MLAIVMANVSAVLFTTPPIISIRCTHAEMNEEVIDAVVRFLRQTKVSVDEIR